MEARPWNQVPICDNGEPLQGLPPALLRIQPHPYQRLGAPYGVAASPFQLRSAVIARLLAAQATVQQHDPRWRVAIFDAWRPLAVQAFMVEQVIAQLCRERGIDAEQPSPARQQVAVEVGRFWAPPNRDPAAPPPHSTGAAVDLTLARGTARASPRLLAMGSAIDAIGPVSEPDHFAEQAGRVSDPRRRRRCLQWQARRDLLRRAMEGAGFIQHPNEWWHFSWGDQLWAWRSGAAQACYGRVGTAEG